MDATALNYNAAATVNTYTWCVPKVVGCMLPSYATLTSATAVGGTRTHTLDGGSTTFAVGATVNSKALCVNYRAGCTNANATNYDVKATVDDGSCFMKCIKGCLNKGALNFNCTSLDFFAACTYTDRALVPTEHLADMCNFYYSPPPVASPAFPPLSNGARVKKSVKMTIKAAGNAADYDEDAKTKLRQTFADKASVDLSAVDIKIVDASVDITVEIAVEDEAQQTSLMTTMEDVMASADAASEFLSSSGISVQVISTPVLETSEIYVSAPPAPPPEGDVGGIIGGVVGGIGGFLMLIGIVAGVMKMKKGQKPIHPA